MCLDLASKSVEAEWKEKQPDTIVMWKVLRRDLTSPIAGNDWARGTRFQYKYGKNKAPSCEPGGNVNNAGFHVYLTREWARQSWQNSTVRKVLVKKKDIVAIGRLPFTNMLCDAVVRSLVLLAPKESRQHGNTTTLRESKGSRFSQNL